MQALTKKKLSVVIVLYLLTGGLYGIYWIISNGLAAAGTTAERQTRVLSSVLLGALIVFFLIVTFAMTMVATYDDVSQSAPSNAGVAIMATVLGGALIYLLAAVISARVANVVHGMAAAESHHRCAPIIAFLLTFVGFVSAIYMQYHINRLN